MGGSVLSTRYDCQGTHRHRRTSGESASVRSSRILKNPLSFRLLKKVQMSRDFAGRRATGRAKRKFGTLQRAPERNNAADGPFRQPARGGAARTARPGRYRPAAAGRPCPHLARPKAKRHQRLSEHARDRSPSARRRPGRSVRGEKAVGASRGAFVPHRPMRSVPGRR